MSNWQKLCEVKIFQLQSMLNAIRCINQKFVFRDILFIQPPASVTKLRVPTPQGVPGILVSRAWP